MLRNLAVLIWALVTMSAQAQDASTPVVEKKPTSVAPSPAEGEQSAIVASLKPPVESDHPLPLPSAPPAKPDVGVVDASARKEPDDCGMEQSLFDQDDVPMGIRFYPVPAAAASPKLDWQQQSPWAVPPAVTTAGRCLRKYVIQVRSESEEPWAIKEAKLVGSDGKVLKVARIRPRDISPNVSLNIITAVRTEGAAGPNYMLRTILLIGEDGRAIVLENVELP